MMTVQDVMKVDEAAVALVKNLSDGSGGKPQLTLPRAIIDAIKDTGGDWVAVRNAITTLCEHTQELKGKKINM